jgi:alkanesulfonate monooxygenase SsuD/methylene tetrahydromethanopterin reductase-like flavin-dependent oxidoreductase (luciferase family)
VPIFIAALRDRMLRLAGEIADGVFLNLLPVSGVAHVVSQVRAGEAAAGRAPGSCEIACRFFCVPQPAEAALDVMRFMFAAYASVPVYAKFFRGLGWGAELDPMVEAWNAKDRAGAMSAAPEGLMREVYVFGTPDEQRAQLARFAQEGIESASLLPVCAPAQLPEFLEAMAPRVRPEPDDSVTPA